MVTMTESNLLPKGDLQHFLDRNTYTNVPSVYTHHEFVLVQVLGFATRIFDLFTEQKIQFKEEDMSLTALSNDLFGIPYMECILQDNLSQFIQGYITAI